MTLARQIRLAWAPCISRLNSPPPPPTATQIGGGVGSCRAPHPPAPQGSPTPRAATALHHPANERGCLWFSGTPHPNTAPTRDHLTPYKRCTYCAAGFNLGWTSDL
ncbi:hypothetical protein BX666DRAFT_1976987, partial [Dichotomocladium elegans]